MLINNILDLRNIRAFPAGNYALSNNINATCTREWNYGKGLAPIYVKGRNMSFYGDFDGNGYSIFGLYINRKTEDNVGLFSNIVGSPHAHSIIKNLKIKDAYIKGDHRVGALCGNTFGVDISNVTLENVEIIGRAVVGGLIGSMAYSDLYLEHHLNPNVSVTASEINGSLIGAAMCSIVHTSNDTAIPGSIGYTRVYDEMECSNKI